MPPKNADEKITSIPTASEVASINWHPQLEARKATLESALDSYHHRNTQTERQALNAIYRILFDAQEHNRGAYREMQNQPQFRNLVRTVRDLRMLESIHREYLLPEQLRDFQAICRVNSLFVIIKPAGPAALDKQRQAAWPKPPHLQEKTIKDSRLMHLPQLRRAIDNSPHDIRGLVGRWSYDEAGKISDLKGLYVNPEGARALRDKGIPFHTEDADPNKPRVTWIEVDGQQLGHRLNPVFQGLDESKYRHFYTGDCDLQVMMKTQASGAGKPHPTLAGSDDEYNLLKQLRIALLPEQERDRMLKLYDENEKKIRKDAPRETLPEELQDLLNKTIFQHAGSASYYAYTYNPLVDKRDNSAYQTGTAEDKARKDSIYEVMEPDNAVACVRGELRLITRKPGLSRAEQRADLEAQYQRAYDEAGVNMPHLSPARRKSSLALSSDDSSPAALQASFLSRHYTDSPARSRRGSIASSRGSFSSDQGSSPSSRRGSASGVGLWTQPSETLTSEVVPRNPAGPSFNAIDFTQPSRSKLPAVSEYIGPWSPAPPSTMAHPTSPLTTHTPSAPVRRPSLTIPASGGQSNPQRPQSHSQLASPMSPTARTPTAMSSCDNPGRPPKLAR